jgi:hypothetical protein
MYNLAAFIALHEPRDEHGRFEYNNHAWVLSWIAKIWDDAPKELYRATNANMWELGNLLSRQTDRWNRQAVVFRKPKITINAAINSRGSFSLTWHPAEEDYKRDKLITMGGYSGRPTNEIFYFQEFREAASVISNPYAEPWDRALRGHLISLFHSMLAEIVKIAERHCDVTVDMRLQLINDPKTNLPVDWEIVNLRELETRKLQAEHAGNVRDLNWKLREVGRLEERFKMTLSQLLAFVAERRSQKQTFDAIEKHLRENSGLEEHPEKLRFMTEIKRIEALAEELKVVETKVKSSPFYNVRDITR